MRRALRLLLPALLLALLLPACSSLGYYGQAVNGQLQLLARRQPIDSLLEAESTPADLRARLALVRQLLDFAAQELALPVHDQYRSYVELDRPFVVWNVFATPEFSMQPKTWCFPVAGCVAYRGWFSEARARADARRLREAGFDVFVGGVAAYSTLGWFSDPVLSTVLYREDHRLAMLLFHELAHQVAYTRDDSVFNESFATAVEQLGLAAWLAANASRNWRGSGNWMPLSWHWYRPQPATCDSSTPRVSNPMPCVRPRRRASLACARNTQRPALPGGMRDTTRGSPRRSTTRGSPPWPPTTRWYRLSRRCSRNAAVTGPASTRVLPGWLACRALNASRPCRLC
jgi:hypothetical protein